MRKALISFFVLALIGINAFSYDFKIYEFKNNEVIYLNNVEDLKGIVRKSIYNGKTTYTQDDYFYLNLNGIKRSASGYISKNDFNRILKSNSVLLNDFYTTSDYIKNAFLNYLYNSNSFGEYEHVNYNNVKYLKDSNGKIVESVYNGKFAGMYDEQEIKSSGILYDLDGNIAYIDGSDYKLGSFFDFSFITNGIRQGVGCLSWVCIAFAITIILVGAIVKYIKYQNGIYTEGIKEDKKLMASIRTEANVLAFRTLTGIDNDKTPDSVWTTYMKDDNELSPLDRERKRQYVDIMQKNYEKWKNKVL